MRFIAVRDLRNRSAQILRDLPGQGEIVVTSNGKPIAFLTPTCETQLNGSLSAIRQARTMRAVAAIQRESVRKGTDRLTAEKIETEIQAVRRERKR